MASSDTRNSFARAVALTGRPRSSRLSISFFLIGPDETCINKKLPCTIKEHNRSTGCVLERQMQSIAYVEPDAVRQPTELYQIGGRVDKAGAEVLVLSPYSRGWRR